MTTEELIAVKFPHLKLSWLQKVNKKLGLVKKENGGNVEMQVRFGKGQPQWTEWKQRDICELSPSHD